MSFRNHTLTIEKEIEGLRNRIKNDVFRVQLKSKDIRTIEEIEIYGTYISGNNTIDDYAGDEVRVIYISIERMLEYYKKGVILYIPRQEDTDNIYKILDTYLRIWKTKLENSFHPENAPIEDLLAYETFAQSMFGVAKYSISKAKPFVAPFIDSLSALPIKSDISNSLRNINFKRTNPEIKEEVKDRSNLDTFFKARKLPITKGRFR